MSVCRVLLYKSKEEPDKYIAEGFEVSRVGVGRNPYEAKSELAKAVKMALDKHREDLSVQLTGANSEEFNRLKKIVSFDGPFRIFEIPKYVTLHIFDCTKIS